MGPKGALPHRKMLIRKIHRISEKMPLYDILNEFQKGHSHIAVVYSDNYSPKKSKEVNIETDPAAGIQNLGLKFESHDADMAMGKSNGDQQKMRSPPPTPAYKKWHRGCSFCILDVKSTPMPEFPPNQVAVGVITMEDVIDELLQEDILDETNEYVNIHHRAIRLSVRIAELNCADGSGHTLEGVEVATSTHFMASKVIRDFLFFDMEVG